MNADKLSVRQLTMCAFAGGLAPAAAAAGYGWQGPLLAAPVILLAGWGLCVLAPRWKAVQDRWTGKLLSALYALWGAALLGRGLRRCADRLTAAGGAEARYKVWLVVLVALPLLWMARGKPAAFFRAAELFCPVVALAGAALLIWGAFRVNWRYVALPAADLWGGFWAALEAGGTFLFALPYINRAELSPKDGKRAMGRLGALSAGTVLPALITAGVLSPAVAAENGQPFFLMTAALGRAVRVEGLASALWLLADLCYLGLLARSWQRTGAGKSWLPPVCVVLGALCAGLGLPDLIPAPVWGWGTAALAAAAGVVLLSAKQRQGSSDRAEPIK